MRNKILPLFLLFTLSLLAFSTETVLKQAESERLEGRKDRHLFWGHYKPHRLSVVTQRSSSPLSVGLMYARDLRPGMSYLEVDEMIQDHLDIEKAHVTARYLANDGANFSKQLIFDNWLRLSYNVTFLKINPGEISQQSWVYLVEPHMENNGWRSTFNTFVYLSGETLDGLALNTFEVVEKAPDRYLLIAYDTVSSTLKGYFEIRVVYDKPIYDSLIPDDTNLTEEQILHYRRLWKLQNPGVEVPDDTNSDKPGVSFCFMGVPPAKAWRQAGFLHQYLIEDAAAGYMRFNESECMTEHGKFNLAILQVRGHANFKIQVTHQSVTKPVNIPSLESIKLSEEYYERQLESKLEEVFPNQKAAYNMDLMKNMRKAAVSNLLGGLSYTYGRIKTTADITSSWPTQPPHELFSSTPSRGKFPRGFLWDEGFHLLIICRWDKVLCLEIVKSWFNTMNAEGWIPREQARGDEQERVFADKQFLFQNEQEANPPTLLFALDLLMQGVNRSSTDYQELVEFLNSGIEEKVIRWFKYFSTTQRNFAVDSDPKFRGPLFRWTCIEPCHGGNVMGSGLDDYPRTNGLDEPLANLDLQVWMILMVKTINAISKFKEEAPKAEFVELEKKLEVSLQEFYDLSDNLYKDLLQNEMGTSYGERVKIFSPHLGYINLFPMFFGSIPNGSPAIKKLISLLRSNTALWSRYGIRSLSVTDPHFFGGERYWTEPVWININYLILRSLKLYYWKEPDAADLYVKLRDALIQVVGENWERTHTFWENYSSIVGTGQRSTGFTGWTALIVLIMSEIY